MMESSSRQGSVTGPKNSTHPDIQFKSLLKAVTSSQDESDKYGNQAGKVHCRKKMSKRKRQDRSIMGEFENGKSDQKSTLESHAWSPNNLARNANQAKT